MSQTFMITAISVSILIWLSFYFIPLGYYFKAKVSGVDISLLEFTKLKYRNRTAFRNIVDCLVISTKADLGLSLPDLEKALKQGCNIRMIVYALASAKNANLSLTFDQACMANQNGIDVLKVTLEAIEKKKEPEL